MITLVGGFFGALLGQAAAGQELKLKALVSGGHLELQWDAVIGRTYLVERATNLTGPWPQVGTLVADTATETWTDPDALGTRYWYRLRFDNDPGNLLFVLPDGDFESGGGVGSGWFQATPFDGSPRIVQTAGGFPVAPRSGSYFVWLGGYLNLDPSTPNNQTIIQYNQSILLPAQSVYLHVWYQVISVETDPFADVFNLWLADILALGPFCNTNALVASPAITASGNTTGWTRAVYDLTP